MSFGFRAVTPDLTGASADGGWDGNNCAGGANAGVAAGASETFKLFLAFDTDDIPPISLTDWIARFQGGCEDGDDPRCEGLPGSFSLVGNGGNGGDLPEPATLALLGLGLLGLGLARRRVA